MSFALYLITDPRTDVVAVTEAALRGAPPGRVAVQVRAKDASASELVSLCRALAPICRAAEAPLLVNDRADVAKAVGADGVQLPERGLSVEDARAVLGPRARVGRSCHDRAGLVRALEDGADFATLAPLASVPDKGAPLGLAGFARAIEGLALPVYALGGVDPELARDAALAGAAGVAVIRAVYGAEDPAAAIRRLLDALGHPDAAPSADAV